MPSHFGPLWRVIGWAFIVGFNWLGPYRVFLQLCMKLSCSGSLSQLFHLIFNARSISRLYINLNYWHSDLTNRLFSFHPLTLILLTWKIWWDPNNASKWQTVLNSAFEGLTFLTTTKADATNVTVGYLEPRRQVIRWIITYLMIQFHVSEFKTMSLTFTVTMNCAIKGLSTLSTTNVYLLYITATCFGSRALAITRLSTRIKWKYNIVWHLKTLQLLCRKYITHITC
jgi:hypothetical protein